MRLAISAANADGSVSDTERAAILDQAKTAGVGEIVEARCSSRVRLPRSCRASATPAQRATLYVLAYTMVRGDEQVTGAERIYLAQLANLLGLDVADGSAARTEGGTTHRRAALA